MSLSDKKVISIGTVSKLSGLSIRQIRYYEERGLLFPDRTKGGTRLYSFGDVEKLVEIAERMDEGFQTHDIQQLEKKRYKNEGGRSYPSWGTANPGSV
ncbi:MerR family transcriptional regulator [Paenibacillus sp. UNC451MF]|uniref:MerR family transcriptional regulator n=1 Tax=Paenibacillus sp. UNC451MF TaxID=1449063 RepID=UPI000690A2A7|nr:MerR family transcriptional regulator [Paenibacillus sp. UNC451MF]